MCIHGERCTLTGKLKSQEDRIAAELHTLILYTQAQRLITLFMFAISVCNIRTPNSHNEFITFTYVIKYGERRGKLKRKKDTNKFLINNNTFISAFSAFTCLHVQRRLPFSPFFENRLLRLLHPLFILIALCKDEKISFFANFLKPNIFSLYRCIRKVAKRRNEEKNRAPEEGKKLNIIY